MKYPFFASFIVFCIWLTYETKKSSKKNKKNNDDFWELESKANNTRKKSLDSLTYVTIPENILSISSGNEDEEIFECYETLRSLSLEPAVNFTGYTNTDLKLKYGAPNIELLIQYDQRYTLLVRTLQKLAERLIANGFEADAISILEFAISTKTDVSSTYKVLRDYYVRQNDTQKLNLLLSTANELKSAMKPSIVRMLQESDQ